jgi:RNA polymerase sigma-70 factor (ECF subfamily)
VADSTETADLLLTRAAQGDKAAFLAFYDRYCDSVFTRLLRMESEPAKAEDLAQEVWVKAAQNVSGYRRDMSPEAWLMTMADSLTPGGAAL